MTVVAVKINTMRRIMMIISAIFAMNLFSCSPLRHYRRVATDISVTEEKRQVIAPWIALNFPPRITKGDTVETVTVDTLYIEDVPPRRCFVFDEKPTGDSSQIANSEQSRNPLGHSKTPQRISERIITKTITRTITDTVEGTATADALRRQLNVCSENERKNSENLSAAKTAKNKWFWLFIAACGIIAGGIISKVKGWL